MTLTQLLRLSYYISLGLAGVCLVFAELAFLPWMVYALPLWIVVLVLAYRKEGEWVVSAREANQLGILLTFAITLWLIGDYYYGWRTPLGPEITWPASMLPHLGPILVILLLVKLFRPKTGADFWMSQIIGLMMVTLSCVLTGEPFFGLMLVAYLMAACWCLALFFLSREQLADPSIPLLSPEKTKHATIPWTGLGLGQAAKWTCTGLVVSFILFLFLPRQANSKWSPLFLATRPTTAFFTGGDSTIDLNRVGTVELSDEVAFTVAAMDVQGGPWELSPMQRWRGPTLDFYHRGRWHPWQSKYDPRETKVKNGAPWHPLVFDKRNPLLPDLGPAKFFVNIHLVPKQAGMLVLAEPVFLGQNPGLHPYRHLLEQPQRSSFFYEVNGNSTLMPVAQPRRPEYDYRQVVPQRAESDLNPAVRLSPDYVRYLVEQNVPEPIGAHTRALLRRLPNLPETAALFDKQRQILPGHWGRTAQALCRHLSLSGEYKYSLELQRNDIYTDPTVDFLLNVRSGHCERFAGGLTLMLRSLGIPARVVKGYQGVELQEDGHYIIRQSRAHSWVEVLVPDKDKPAQLNWLSLDPTPVVESAAQKFSWWRWFLDNWRDGRIMWKNLVTDYDREQQAGVVQGMRHNLLNAAMLRWLSRVLRLVGYVAFALLLGLLAVLGLGKLRRRLRRAPRGEKREVSFYDHLLAVLKRRCQLEPYPAQTPREFAHAAAKALATIAPAKHLASLPVQAAECFYRIHYGKEQLTPQEKQALLQSITDLEAVLR